MAEPKLLPLERQVIVITGATSGIGLATARMAARRGAALVLLARNALKLQRLSSDLNADGAVTIAVATDVRNAQAVEDAAERALEKFGRIDTWVNNAGIGAYATLDALPPEDHRRVFDTNYWGVVHGSLAARSRMRDTGGAIVNLGSVLSDIGAPLLGSYAASKHAVKGFTDSLRLETIHERLPLSITLIKPSSVGTPFGEHAENRMGAPARVPPPVYHPDVVAQAILHAAEHPVRSLTIGGAGQAMVWFAQTLPSIADPLISTAFFRMARAPAGPLAQSAALFRASEAQPRSVGPQRIDRRTSLWTLAQMRNPMLTQRFGRATVTMLSMASQGLRGFARIAERAARSANPGAGR